MARAERVMVPLRMPAALRDRIDQISEGFKEQIGPAAGKWSRNDQIVAMLEFAAPSWEEGMAGHRSGQRAARLLIPRSEVERVKRERARKVRRGR